jgi:hypothetical protein
MPEPSAAPVEIGGRSKWSKRRAREFMAAQPKRAVMIERTADDLKQEQETGKPVHQFVMWNGWSYLVPKGRVVEVPEPIAAILDQSRELFRTTQAREAKSFFTDIGESLGIELDNL